MKYRVTAAIAALLAAGSGWAQAPVPTKQSPPPDKPVQETQAPENQVINPEQRVTGPLPPAAAAAREIRLDTSEGSWMNVDVSPDGRTIAFDMLGDIYTMPIAGGTPRRIAEGLAYEQQPRFSPDGRRIAFVSDR